MLVNQREAELAVAIGQYLLSYARRIQQASSAPDG